ncbi:glycine-rich protein DOT1-like [Arachis stenosperma]|uniref:glycine-rich protein DOT1-like n=1 Tax=Arachis stenosperma TaxID=217475 RepID=UPI0025AD7B4A|nr:glycine-rich protein DOT1-like [Arachis stenosperma]
MSRKEESQYGTWCVYEQGIGQREGSGDVAAPGEARWCGGGTGLHGGGVPVVVGTSRGGGSGGGGKKKREREEREGRKKGVASWLGLGGRGWCGGGRDGLGGLVGARWLGERECGRGVEGFRVWGRDG